MNVIPLIIVGVIVLVALWAFGIFNGLVRKRTLVQEGWSGIETQLKRRADLVPNLVETVKGYAAHERGTFDEVTEMRAKATGATTIPERAQAEQALTGALGRLMAVAENYPELKANQNFLSLQGDLSKIEDDLQSARRYYNATVRDNNIMVQSFPSNLLASSFGFKTSEFFELDNPADRQAPKVSFDKTA